MVLNGMLDKLSWAWAWGRNSCVFCLYFMFMLLLFVVVRLLLHLYWHGVGMLMFEPAWDPSETPALRPSGAPGVVDLYEESTSLARD